MDSLVIAVFSLSLLLFLNCSKEGETMTHQFTNRLVNEKSPYLLQHAHNPVDWYPWGEEAFAAAKAADKPIFLSIGYSTCHWCHVMEHESFEDTSVAELMNDAFINIKVDREERPDVDDIYMTVCQLLTQRGGWPLTIIMTPDKEPFFAGTYIPKDSRFNRPGMMQLVPGVKRAWAEQREQVLKSAREITDALKKSSGGLPPQKLNDSILDSAFQSMENRFDPEYGGFGEHPKFPTAHNLMFLLRYFQRSGDPHALAMVEKTLQEMRKGGMYDHVGFGFHRYSTDKEWLLPHFEKMLYDQAINAMAYTETYQITGNEIYKSTAEEVFAYVLRDMTDAQGGFYSAEDADSEGEEGKFYVWEYGELIDVLGEEDGALYATVFNFKEKGNFRDEATGVLHGANIPHLKDGLAVVAAANNLTLPELTEKLAPARQKLFEVREKRIHPLKDDKILTDWNGLMIAAFAKAAQAFDAPEYAGAASKAADFILENMRTKEGRLMHRYREGEIAINGYLDDYAFMIWGLLELYETNFQIKYLQSALDLNAQVLKHFWDDNDKAFFFTADDSEALLLRKKDVYDGAVPSGNSVMVLNLLRLSRITANTDFEARAAQITETFGAQVARYPDGFTMLLMGQGFGVGPSWEIVICGDPAAQDTKDMLQAIQQRFLPNKVILLKSAEDQGILEEIANYTAGMQALDDKATAYVCRDFSCELPTSNILKMLASLQLNEK